MPSHGQFIRQHGSLHFPEGEDPVVGPWITVGDTTNILDQNGNPLAVPLVLPAWWPPAGYMAIPGFQNGWTNIGGIYQTLRFRWVLGHGSEIQGSVTGGGGGTVIFTLPNLDIYRNNRGAEGVVVQAGADSIGGFVAYRVYPTGEVYHGF